MLPGQYKINNILKNYSCDTVRSAESDYETNEMMKPAVVFLEAEKISELYMGLWL